MTMTRLWNVIGVVGVVLILLLGYAVGVSPALASASTSDDDLMSVEAQNQVKEAELAVLKALAEDSDQLFADLAKAQLAIPGTQESSEFASQISSLAASAGVELTELTYSEVAEALAPEFEGAAAPATEGETEESAASDEPAAPVETPTSSTQVQTVPGLVSVGVSIKVKGSLAEVIEFINNVQLHQRAFSVSSAAVRLGGDTGEYELGIEGAVYALASSGAPIASSGESSGVAN
ncbi:hypothetical protein [Salinibacterium sp. PAMC 21357]|uniref:hypothetical protein n=1 Tax=Salinibacterium sp. PAMC 21357 TaxID=1112215 RepID=UPI0002892DB7|nr:hypothetical protein [Salinibacterium sp. PAMC 21357]